MSVISYNKAAIDQLFQTARDRTNHTGTQSASSISDFTEAVQDAAFSMFRAGTNVTFNYDDAANTLTVNASGGGAGGTDPEIVRDTIGGALVGGANIQITLNDSADTITIQVVGLAAVATTGSYASLTGKPTIPSAPSDIGAQPAGSYATTSDLAAKAPLASPAFTGTPTGITKTHVGLGNVDNTADSSKPISAATQSALNDKLATASADSVLAGLIGNSSSAVRAALLTLFGNVKWQVDTDGNPYFSAISAGTTPAPNTVTANVSATV